MWSKDACQEPQGYILLFLLDETTSFPEFFSEKEGNFFPRIYQHLIVTSLPKYGHVDKHS